MTIRYDSDRVKRPHIEEEYTTEQVQELVRCTESCEYFCKKYIKIVTNDYGIISFSPYEYQDELLEKFKKHRFNIALLSRQSGKSTIVAAYALWFALFHDNKNIGIASNKEKAAKSFLSRLKAMYERLPSWIKPGVKGWAETSIKFDNGTEIQISATSKDSFRGEPMSLVILDEFAFVDPTWKADEFWKSNYPTISASKTAKIIIISTPNGLYNKFHEIYTKAEKGKNQFEHSFYDWRAVPGRDEEWAKRTKDDMGEIPFNQEFGCKFIGSTSTVLNAETIERLLAFSHPNPSILDLKDKFRVFERPKDGEQYVLGVDTAKGTGEHYSTIQVLRVDSTVPINLTQVAVYEANDIDVYKFAEVVNKICYFYNNAYIMVENNAEGSTVVSQLWWEYENENLINEGQKTTKLGIRATKATKPKAVLLMKKLIEDKHLHLIDLGTCRQLSGFVDKGNNVFKGDSIDDDLVSGLYWACYFFEMDIMEDKYAFKKNKEDDDDSWGILSDVNNYAEEDWSWLTK